ncbi:MAG: heparinase II/III family protein [Streptococcus sp.]|nr:heparinase II/III family protein [Streptococcus sp.]
MIKENNYFKSLDLSFCRNYIKKHQIKNYKSIKEVVDLMMNNTFIFMDNWDMEPCSTPHHLEPLDWDEPVTNDPEWNYMLNRQTYLMKFIIVYLIEQDDSYLVKMKKLLLHWIEQHQTLTTSSLSNRTLDTGIRCMVWVKLLLFLRVFDQINADEMNYILLSLQKQIAFLMENYVDKYSLSNWGIFQTVAIIVCDYYFGENIAIEEARKFAEKELEQQLTLQILEDGVQFEQSIMYHVEVFQVLVELAILVPKYKHKLKEILTKMAIYIQMMTGPDNYQIALGDSDKTDTRDILTLASIVLENPYLKTSAFPKVDINTLMLIGKEGVEIFEKLSTFKQPQKSIIFKQSGQVCIHKEDYFLFFKNGPLGSSHTHSDLNSLCLYSQGKPLFVDSGRFTYREDDLRYKLKSAQSHSTCFVDDMMPEKITGSWTYQTYPESLFCHLNEIDDVVLVEGYLQTRCLEETNYGHLRTIICLPHQIFIICDKVNCVGNHQLTTQFILDSSVKNHGQIINHLKIISDIPFQKEEATISEKYNHLTPTKKLVKRQNFCHNIIDTTLFVHQNISVKKLAVLQTGGNRSVPNALAWEFQGEGCHYIVGILSDDLIQGEKLVTIDGIKFRGKVVIYDKKQKRTVRLKT